MVFSKKQTITKRKYVRRPYKKKVQRRPRQYKQTGVQGRAGIGLPETKMVSLTYCETITLTPGTATPINYTFRMNDIYDPNYTGTGHQPLGRDEWAQLYEKYEVTSAMLKARYYWANSVTGGGAGQAYHVGCTFDTGPAIATLYSTRQEKLKGHAKLLVSDLSKTVNLTEKFNANQWFGDKSVSVPIDIGTSPATAVVCFANLWAQTADGASGEQAAYVDVRIEYKVRLTNPKEILGS